jgi:hypothetical protein
MARGGEMTDSVTVPRDILKAALQAAELYWPTTVSGKEQNIKLIEKLQALLNSPSEPTGWQPIEKAPKDGTVYLAYANGKIFTENKPPNCYPGEWEWNEHRQQWRGRAGFWLATHWMPLPPLPKAPI